MDGIEKFGKSKRQSRNLLLVRTAGKKSPVRKEILHCLTSSSADSSRTKPVRKLSFSETGQENDASLPSRRRTKPETAVESFHHTQTTSGKLRVEKQALLDTVKGMLDERSRSGVHRVDVSGSSDSQIETGGLPAKRVVRQRPQRRQDESIGSSRKQSEMIDQLDMLHTVLSQGTPTRVQAVDNGMSELEEASRIEQQRLIVKDIKEELQLQFASQQMSINRLHDDRAKLMRQLEDTSESLSASAHEVSHLRQQIMIQDEQKLSLQKTIADKTRQTEGLLTQIHDLRHQLNEMSESNTSKQKSVVQDISKLQQQQRELRGEIERKAEELAAVTKKKQDAEKQLSSLKKAHATEMQHVKADLTRKVNKLNREAEQLVTEKRSMQSGIDHLMSENERVSEALREADSRNTELTTANEGLHKITDQYVHRINELTEAAAQSAAQSKMLSENIQKLTRQKEHTIEKMQHEERRHQEVLIKVSEEKQTLQLRLEQSSSDVSNLRQQLQAVEQLVSHRTQQQMQSLTSQLVKKSRATEQLKERNESLRLQVKSQKREIGELKEALHGSSLDVTRLEVDRDRIQTAAKQSQLELLRLNEQNASLQLQVSKLNETLATVSHNSFVTVQPENDAGRKWSESSDISTVTFKDLDTSVVNNSSYRLSDRLSDRLDNLQQSYELQSESLSDKQKQLNSLKDSHSEIVRVNERLKAALEERNSELQLVRSQLDESMSAMKAEQEQEVEAMSKKHATQLHRLTDEKAAIVKDNDSLKSRLDETLKHLAEVGTALFRADQTVEELRAQCRQLNENCQSTESRLAQQAQTARHEKLAFQQQVDAERASQRQQKDSKLVNLETRLQRLQQQYRQSIEKVATTTEKLSNSDAARLAAEQLNQRLKQQVTDLEARQSQECERLKFLSEEREQLQSVVVICEEERRLLQEKVQSLEEANLKLARDSLNKSNQSNSDSSDYSFMELVSKPQRGRPAARSGEVLGGLASGEVDELKSLLKVVSEEKHDLKEKLTSLRDTEQKREEEMVVLRGRVEELKKENVKHKTVVREKEAVVLNLQSNIARMSGKVKEMENSSPQADQLLKLKAKLDHFVQQKNYEINDLQQHYRTEIQTRELEYQQQKETVEMQKKQLEVDIESLQQVARQEIQKAVHRLGQEKDIALHQMKQQHNTEIEKLKAHHQQELLQKRTTSDEVSEAFLKSNQAQEVERLQADHKKETAKLTAECEELRKVMHWLQQQWEEYSSTCFESVTANSQEVLARESTAVQTLADQYDDVTTKLDELSAENAESRDVLVSKETTVDALVTDVETLKERKEKLRQQVTAKREEMLEMKLSNISRRCEELEQEVLMLQEQVSGLEEEKSHVTSTFKARIKDRDSLLKETQSTLESVIKEKESLEQQLLLLSTSNAASIGVASREQLTNCLEQLKELRSQHRLLQAHYHKLIEEEQDKDIELKSLHSTRDKLKQQTVELKSSQMKIKSENEALRSMNEEMSREHTVLTTKISHLTSMYEQLKSVNEKLRERNAQLQEERRGLLSSLSESGLHGMETTDEENELNGSCRHLREAIRTSKEKLKSLQSEKMIVEEAVDNLVRQMDGLVGRRQTLERQVEELEKVNPILSSGNGTERQCLLDTSPVTDGPFVSLDTNSSQQSVDSLREENVRLQEVNCKLTADVDHLRNATSSDKLKGQRVEKIERQLMKTKEKLKMKQRQANYLRLKLGATLIELREMRQGLK